MNWKRARVEPGQGLVEYGLLLGMLTLVVVAILSLMHDKIGFTFSALLSNLP